MAALLALPTPTAALPRTARSARARRTPAAAATRCTGANGWNSPATYSTSISSASGTVQLTLYDTVPSGGSETVNAAITGHDNPDQSNNPRDILGWKIPKRATAQGGGGIKLPTGTFAVTCRHESNNHSHTCNFSFRDGGKRSDLDHYIRPDGKYAYIRLVVNQAEDARNKVKPQNRWLFNKLVVERHYTRNGRTRVFTTKRDMQLMWTEDLDGNRDRSRGSNYAAVYRYTISRGNTAQPWKNDVGIPKVNGGKIGLQTGDMIYDTITINETVDQPPRGQPPPTRGGTEGPSWDFVQSPAETR